MDPEAATTVSNLGALQQTSFFSVAALSIVLYDHAQTLSKEVELIWIGTVSPLTLLYFVNRYMGNAMLIAGTIVSVSTALSTKVSYKLLEFEAWGTLVNVWVVQSIMQPRIFAMYHRSKRVGAFLGVCFLAEIVTTAVILWLNVGPHSSFAMTSITVFTGQLCVATGIRGNFMVMTYVPIVCFELLLFILAARISAKNILEVIRLGGTERRMNSLMRVLARDSLIYFLINLAITIIFIILWLALSPIYGQGISVPLVDFVVVTTGSRLALSLRGHRARNGVWVGGVQPGARNHDMDEAIPLHALGVNDDSWPSKS
ncbi:hypothetical protein BV22DRAFT_292032 [Leucogyrophana mollusca]|uniref:Uncharacterized protein n=1 Tax=Leucogyrophana mollusca TaxID=85980 RepID=A0ACB8BMU8_9AGAM|nr:hypothetical protein BV22DRAFT_292032 [Leucogyrophana mollusca]